MNEILSIWGILTCFIEKNRIVMVYDISNNYPIILTIVESFLIKI